MMRLSAKEAMKLAESAFLDNGAEEAVRKLTNKSLKFNQKPKKDEKRSIAITASC